MNLTEVKDSISKDALALIQDVNREKPAGNNLQDAYFRGYVEGVMSFLEDVRARINQIEI